MIRACLCECCVHVPLSGNTTQRDVHACLPCSHDTLIWRLWRHLLVWMSAGRLHSFIFFAVYTLLQRRFTLLKDATRSQLLYLRYLSLSVWPFCACNIFCNHYYQFMYNLFFVMSCGILMSCRYNLLSFSFMRPVLLASQQAEVSAVTSLATLALSPKHSNTCTATTATINDNHNNCRALTSTNTTLTPIHPALTIVCKMKSQVDYTRYECPSTDVKIYKRNASDTILR